MMSDATGTFTISLDTELAWGTFDIDGGIERYDPAYRRSRRVVDDMCDLFDRYEVPATWAVVAHLLEDCGGDHPPFPTVDFRWFNDWFGSLPCRSGVADELWYAEDVVERIRAAAVDHEIGLHGYSHLILGEPGCSREAAAAELRAGVETLRDAGVDPTTFVFPRNRIAHRDVLADNGIEAYRGLDGRWYEPSLPEPAKKPFRFLDEALCRTPAVVTPREVDGLVEIPGSQVFRPYHDGWQFTLPSSQRRRGIRGLDRAAETGGVFHLRFHPFDLGFEPDRLLSQLEMVLSHAATLRNAGDLTVHTLADVAAAYRNGDATTPET